MLNNALNILEVVLDRLVPKLAIDTVEDFHQLLRQWALLNDVHVCGQLGSAGSADDDRITLCMIQDAMIRGPPESSRVAIDSVLGCHCRSVIRSNCDLGLRIMGCIELAHLMLVAHKFVSPTRAQEQGGTAPLTEESNRLPDWAVFWFPTKTPAAAGLYA